jgi:ABC-type glycerol-3-phosphate transport system permease component
MDLEVVRMIWRIGGRRFSLPDTMIWLLGMGWAFMWMIPLAWMLSTSFKPRDQILTKVPQWVPQDFTWWNYQTVFEEPMLRWFWNSLVVSVITTLLMLLVASTAGYALARIEFPGRGGLFTTYLMAMIIPFEVLAVPMYLMFAYFNLTDTYFSLIMPMASGSFAVYLFRQFFYALPSELEDAAMIDGCDRLGVFLRIVLPLARPVIVASTIIVFTASWNNWLWPLLTISSDASRTVTIGVLQFGAFTGGMTRVYWGVVMAAATVAVLPIIILFVVLQRYFVQGISQTGIR